MKRWLTIIGLMIGVFTVLSADVDVDTDDSIQAGDEWTVSLTVADAIAGDTVDVVLVNGLQTFHETLTLGSGGVARWHLPEDTLTQAGESVLIVRHGETESRMQLRVNPERPVTGELFSTGNAIPAYGNGSASVIVLPRDRWGNAPIEHDFAVNIRYPDGSDVVNDMTYRPGIAWSKLVSRGDPGRIQLRMPALDAELDIMQTPGTAQALSLSVKPECIRDDSPDRIMLDAIVTDHRGNNVTDGTLVTFYWQGGQGYGRTVDGRATLYIPHPGTPGFVLYQATAGTASPAAAVLVILGEACNG